MSKECVGCGKLFDDVGELCAACSPDSSVSDNKDDIASLVETKDTNEVHEEQIEPTENKCVECGGEIELGNYSNTCDRCLKEWEIDEEAIEENDDISTKKKPFYKKLWVRILIGLTIVTVALIGVAQVMQQNLYLELEELKDQYDAFLVKESDFKIDRLKDTWDNDYSEYYIDEMTEENVYSDGIEICEEVIKTCEQYLFININPTEEKQLEEIISTAEELIVSYEDKIETSEFN